MNRYGLNALLLCALAATLADALSATAGLGRKSTTRDVLRNLNGSGRLAPYVAGEGTAVVTGASSGIGVPSVEALALSGMRVVMACRNVEDGERARAALPDWIQPRVRVQELDLADLGAIRGAVEAIREQEGQIDLLLNNAGVMNIPKRTLTKDGFEMQLGTNHVGHHMLTRLLLPSVRRGGRIVTVASSAHQFGTFDFDDLNYGSSKRSYSPWGAYGQSKLANVLFAKGLDDRLKKEGRDDILSVSLHPGVIGTNLWRSSGPAFLQPLLTNVVGDRSIDQGASTSVFASLVEASAFSGGEYLADCGVAKPSERGNDANSNLREELWKKTEEMISDAGYALPVDILY